MTLLNVVFELFILYFVLTNFYKTNLVFGSDSINSYGKIIEKKYYSVKLTIYLYLILRKA